VISQREPVIRHGPARAGDIMRSVGSPRLATATLGISARTSLADGLTATLGLQKSLERV